MDSAAPTPTALDDVRVLDLAGEIGVYCARLLADLGADVVRIEPPEGDPLRRLGPFYHDEPDVNKGLLHFIMNTSKRGITLNLEHPDGQELFRRLVATADVVVESFEPGYLEELGLGYEELREINPRLIMTSITPFGQTGPYRHLRATNIVGDALGGLMYVSGNPEDPPLMSAANQGYYLAGMQGSVATLTALFHRDMTGEGQHADISMEEAVALSVQPQAMFWPGRRESPGRFGYGQRTSNVPIYASSFYPCKDGWITGLGTQARNWPDMVAWLQDEGVAEDLGDPHYLEEQVRVANATHIQDILSRFAASRTMEELANGGQGHHLFLFPAFSVKDIVHDVHLKQRNFFVKVPHPELDEEITYPGAPYGLTETPWRIARRAPLLGEHNHEVYVQELGIPPQKLALLRTAGAI
ncbi:MAG: CoA transferase [Chloroflexi bacterium]|nr:CoA transferase [Chloroflexota bacterium]